MAGAGIIGASIAYHLAREGAEVTVIDQQAPASHASRGTFAWINATWAKQPKHYHALSQASVAYWRELGDTLQLPVRWGGSLEWFADEDRTARLAEQIDEQIAWGEPAQMIDAAEFSTIEPNVQFIGGTYAALSRGDGAVDPVLATQKLLAAAEALGAKVSYPCQLLDVRMTAATFDIGRDIGRLDQMQTNWYWRPALPRTSQSSIADIEIPPAQHTRCHCGYRANAGMILQHIIAAPGIHLHQRSDGRVVIGEQDGAPQNDAHAARLAGRPNDFPC